jgi:hypothetical protein
MQTLNVKLKTDQRLETPPPPPPPPHQILSNKNLTINNCNSNSNTPQQHQSSNPLRLLIGKLVFLDLNAYKLKHRLVECLSLIEVVIRFYLNKKIDLKKIVFIINKR